MDIFFKKCPSCEKKIFVLNLKGNFFCPRCEMNLQSNIEYINIKFRDFIYIPGLFIFFIVLVICKGIICTFLLVLSVDFMVYCLFCINSGLVVEESKTQK